MDQLFIGKKSGHLKNPVFHDSYFNFVKYIGIIGYRTQHKEVYFPIYIKEFLSFMEARGLTHLDEIDSHHIHHYRRYIYQRPNKITGEVLAKSTISEHFYAIGLYFDYLFNTEKIKQLPYFFSKFKFGHPKSREVLTRDEIFELYEAAQNQLELAILTLAYGCGLRRSEIYHLNINDLYLQKGVLVVRAGKGGKHRVIPLSKSNRDYLKQYTLGERQDKLKGLTHHHTQALLVNTNGHRLTGNRANQILKEIVRRSSKPNLLSKNISLHCLRHSIATHLIENHAGIEFVRDFLGHQEINTTNIYIIKRKQITNFQKKLL